MWAGGTLGDVTYAGVLLVVRRHVDFQRVSSALCRAKS
ncbi:putative leader peptide [Amycolatopsis nigrescens]